MSDVPLSTKKDHIRQLDKRIRKFKKTDRSSVLYLIVSGETEPARGRVTGAPLFIVRIYQQVEKSGNLKLQPRKVKT